MLLKDASKKFGLSERQLRMVISDNLLPEAKKINGVYHIDDSIQVILTKSQIKGSLVQIIKDRNCPGYPISRRLFPDNETLGIVLDRLYILGFITKKTGNDTEEKLFEGIQITDDGFSLLFDKRTRNLLENLPPVSIGSLVTVKVACVK